MKALSLVGLFLICVTSTTLFAESSPDDKALKDTQELLRSQSQRDKAIKESPDAANADRAVEQLTGTAEGKQQVYELASDVMANLVKQTNGDTAKMNQLLEEAKKNPEAFANTFSSDQKQKLRDISQKIPAKMP